MNPWYANLSTEALARLWYEKMMDTIDISNLIYSRPDGADVMQKMLKIISEDKGGE